MTKEVAPANRFRFRAWDTKKKIMLSETQFSMTGFGKTFKTNSDFEQVALPNLILMQSTGLTDKNGKEIFEGDILEFTDKWEWYRIQWSSKLSFSKGEERKKLQSEYDALPMHRRVVEVSAAEGVNFSTYDLQQGRFAVVGNLYENPDLLPS